jgi:hypothetical protein
MVNTGDYLSMKVEESLIILESPDASHFSNSPSSFGTHQEVQGLMALPKAGLQTQGWPK